MRFATAELNINVQNVDLNPPVLTASSLSGYVRENAKVGTPVLDGSGKPIQFVVEDLDMV